MKLDLNSIKPLYLQISEGIEEDIINNILLEGCRVYSQYQVANEYSINPATAGKGLKLLEEQNILLKKRGLGMFVSNGAKEIIIKKRRDNFTSKILVEMMLEAQRLGLSKKDILKIIEGKI